MRSIFGLSSPIVPYFLSVFLVLGIEYKYISHLPLSSCDI